MARYDSPGFMDQTPGGPVGQQGFTSPGTAPPSEGASTSAGYPPPTDAATATVTIPGASTVNADRIPVSPLDTLVPAEADSYGRSPDPLTGIGRELGETGAGQGAPRGPHHPNSSHPELAP